MEDSYMTPEGLIWPSRGSEVNNPISKREMGSDAT
jgi:hypothetical protein